MNKFIIKKLLPVLLFLSISTVAGAQEKNEAPGPFSASIGPEWNMNSRYNFAGGVAFGIYYNLPERLSPTNRLSAGLTATGSINFFGTQVTEFAGLIRWYYPQVPHNGMEYTGLFTQFELGAFFINEEGERTVLPLAGLRGGYRLPISSHFYIEPCGRLGYPFAFGIGLMAGISF